MATTYTADPTATQAPSDPPVDGTPPKATLPADGDPLIAASVAQMAKVAVDFEAYFQAPFANASQWTQNLIAYENALGQPISGYDHFGLSRTSTYGWTENWDHSLQYVYGAGPGNRQVGRWHQALGGTTGAIDNPPPGAGFVAGNPFVQQRAIRFATGIVANDSVSMNLDPDSAGLIFTDDTLASVDFPVFADGFANITYAFGFAGAGNSPDTGNGAYFYKDNTFPQWQCRTAVGSVTHTSSSGITATANTVYRCRVILVGANRDDAGTARALFLINEAVVSNITVDLPVNVNVVPAFSVTPNAGAAAQEFAFGAVRYCQSIYPGGIF